MPCPRLHQPAPRSHHAPLRTNPLPRVLSCSFPSARSCPHDLRRRHRQQVASGSTTLQPARYDWARPGPPRAAARPKCVRSAAVSGGGDRGRLRHNEGTVSGDEAPESPRPSRDAACERPGAPAGAVRNVWGGGVSGRVARLRVAAARAAPRGAAYERYVSPRVRQYTIHTISFANIAGTVGGGGDARAAGARPRRARGGARGARRGGRVSPLLLRA